MTKIINKNTNVVKEIKNEFETSMYLGTGEWELYQEKAKQEEKIAKTPIINTNSKEEN